VKSFSEILDELQGIDVGIKCRLCGAVPMLVGKQYSVRCPSCGTNITVSPSYLVFLKEKEYKARNDGKSFIKRHKCNICKDRGFVILNEQMDELVYEFGYRCICQAGQKREDLLGWPVVPAAKVRPRLDVIRGGKDVTGQTAFMEDV